MTEKFSTDRKACWANCPHPSFWIQDRPKPRLPYKFLSQIFKFGGNFSCLVLRTKVCLPIQILGHLHHDESLEYLQTMSPSRVLWKTVPLRRRSYSRWVIDPFISPQATRRECRFIYKCRPESFWIWFKRFDQWVNRFWNWTNRTWHCNAICGELSKLKTYNYDLAYLNSALISLGVKSNNLTPRRLPNNGWR